ncbi:MAG: protein-export rane protein SecF [Deltaproteobacteria bacterium]|nr:protein-export rane protein SecF [Deltaproteobacteria bacterium]
MSEHHKFRYLLPPGNNFQFVAKFRIWMIMSVLLMAAAIGSLFVNKSVRGEYMNWTIDFKGGTEIHFAFKDKQTNKYIKVDPAKIRGALEKSGEESIDVSDIGWRDEAGVDIEGMVVRTPRFSAIPDAVKNEAMTSFAQKFQDRKPRATWSGDRFKVRSSEPISNAEAVAFFATIQSQGGKGLEVKPWSDEETEQYTTRDEGTKEFVQWYGIWGIDRQYQQIFESSLGKDKTEIIVVQSYGVGAKAGDRLRDDAAKSIVYAIFLIMLYLAFRFDIRYAPGAAFATIHDAVMVIGVFALTWTEVSLTSVAGLLTVMGFSVNDTVIVFDRIRENQAKLKDKKIERIIDISINEMLVRTILTSSTVFATTLIMNIFGTGLVKNFAFAMNVGVIVGTYSSIFLAVPIFMWVSKKWYSGPAPARRRAAIGAASATAASASEPSEPSEPSATSSDDE